MGHINKENYIKLQKRLDMAPQGAPASESLFKILEILFTEEEAKLAAALPLKLFNVKTAAKIWKKSEKESFKILDELANKGILMDIKTKDRLEYILAPTMAGFFEFSLMRTDGKFNRKILSELYYQYINVEKDFGLEVLSIDPCIARTFIHEDTLQKEDQMIILDYERASKVIENATHCSVGTCYCRHKMEHMGKACKMPQQVCLTFNNAARSLSDHGIAKKISKKEAKKILDKCVKLGLVQIGDNVQDRVGWICNCCGCCCEALMAYKKFGGFKRINSNFEALVHEDKCTKCTICIKKCPVDAIKLNKKGFAEVNKEICIGCGVCTRYCPSKTISMKRRKETIFVPKDSFERTIVSAIKENKLQNYVFSNNTLWTAHLLRKFIGVIFSLPPTKWLLLNNQLKSKFLASIAKKDPLFKEQARNLDYTHPELKKKS